MNFPCPSSSMRMLVGPCKSGTSALQKCFTENKDVRLGAYQYVKSGLRLQGREDYSVFAESTDDKPGMVIAKEAIGHSTVADCRLQVFPGGPIKPIPEYLEASRPVFIMREPVPTYNSWKFRDWGNTLLFIIAYDTALRTFEVCRDAGPNTLPVTFEQFKADPHAVVQRMCTHWGLEYSPAMVNEWESTFFHDRKIDYKADIRLSSAVEMVGKGISLEKSRGVDFRDTPHCLVQEERILLFNTLQEGYEKYAKEAAAAAST